MRAVVVAVMVAATASPAHADGFDVSIPFEGGGAQVPSLPRTGASILLLLAVSMALIALGTALVVAVRSRMRAFR